MKPLKDSALELHAKRWLEAMSYRVHRAAKSAKHYPAKRTAQELADLAIAEVLIATEREDVAAALARIAAAAQPALVTRTETHDLFGAVDLLAVRSEIEPTTWMLQTTTLEGLSARRRKIESVPWPPSWRLSLLSHEPPAKRGAAHAWRIEDFMRPVGDLRHWAQPRLVPFDMAELKARAGQDLDEAELGEVERVKRPRTLACKHLASELEEVDGQRGCRACRVERVHNPLFFWRSA